MSLGQNWRPKSHERIYIYVYTYGLSAVPGPRVLSTPLYVFNSVNLISFSVYLALLTTVLDHQPLHLVQSPDNLIPILLSSPILLVRQLNRSLGVQKYRRPPTLDFWSFILLWRKSIKTQKCQNPLIFSFYTFPS